MQVTPVLFKPIFAVMFCVAEVLCVVLEVAHNTSRIRPPVLSGLGVLEKELENPSNHRFFENRRSSCVFEAITGNFKENPEHIINRHTRLQRSSAKVMSFNDLV
jgi:hypothetical protein